MKSKIADILPLRKGTNFAPVKPLLAVKDRRAKHERLHYFCDGLKERYAHFMAKDRETWQDLITTGHLVSLFLQGKQNLKFNKLTKNFYSVPVQQNDNKTKITPIMGFYGLNCQARYMTSNPKITVNAASEDDRVIQAAKAAKIVVDRYERQLYTNWFNIHEAILTMSFGTTINRIRWDSGRQGLKAITEIFEDREYPISKGVGQCYECGHAGTGEEYLANGALPMCPNCGSENAYAEPGASSLIPTKVGEEAHNLGDITIKTLEFPACRYDLRHRAEESSFFIYEEMASAGVIQQYLGNIDIPGDTSSGDSFGLEIVEALAKEGLAVNGRTQNNSTGQNTFGENVKITEMSLSASDLAGLTVSGDEETVDGEKLPKGAKYSDLFPNGMTAVGINGFEVVLGVYAESHKNELTTGVWHVRPFSGAGRGQSDSVEIQKRKNETDSQGYLAMRHNATPATFYAKDAIEEGYLHAVGKPDVAIPVDLSQFPGANLDNLISSPRIGSTDTALLSYFSQTMDNMMQLTMGSTSFSGGLPGVNNKTATGARISDANAEQLFAPMLGIKVDVRTRAAKLFVEHYRENVPVKTFFPLEKKYGSQNGKWLSGADIEGDFTFSIVKNSELSTNRWTVIEDNERFMMAVGGAQGLLALQEAKPEFADELMRRYGVDLETNHQDEVAQICRQRFQYGQKLIEQFAEVNAMQTAAALLGGGDPQAQQMAEPQPMEAQMPAIPKDDASPIPPTEAEVVDQQLQQMAQPAPAPVDPITAQAIEVVMSLMPPISLYELHHADKAKWFMTFLDTDEGRELDTISREVVFKMIEAHFQNGTQQQVVLAQMSGAIQTAGAAPGMAADVMRQKASQRDDVER